MPELARQEVADPASDQIRTGSALPAAGDAKPESDHRHDVRGDGGSTPTIAPRMNPRPFQVLPPFTG